MGTVFMSAPAGKVGACSCNSVAAIPPSITPISKTMPPKINLPRTTSHALNGIKNLTPCPSPTRRGEIFPHLDHSLAGSGEIFPHLDHSLARSGEIFPHLDHSLARSGEIFPHLDHSLARSGEIFPHLDHSLARSGEIFPHPY